MLYETAWLWCKHTVHYTGNKMYTSVHLFHIFIYLHTNNFCSLPLFICRYWAHQSVNRFVTAKVTILDVYTSHYGALILLFQKNLCIFLWNCYFHMACDFSMYSREVFCIRIVVTQRKVVLWKKCVLFSEQDISHKHHIHIYANNPWSDEININEHVCYNLLLALCYIFYNVLFYVLL